MFMLYISPMYRFICSSYGALIAGDLYKTSRQKLQIEKVIIPVV